MGGMEAKREQLRGQSATCGGQATSENQTPSSTEVSEHPLGSRADLRWPVALIWPET